MREQVQGHATQTGYQLAMLEDGLTLWQVGLGGSHAQRTASTGFFAVAFMLLTLLVQGGTPLYTLTVLEAEQTSWLDVTYCMLTLGIYYHALTWPTTAPTSDTYASLMPALRVVSWNFVALPCRAELLYMHPLYLRLEWP